MAYRDPSPIVYREPAQTELRFFAGTWGSLIVAGFWLAVMSLMVILLTWWDTQVTGHCDRGICRFGDRVIPFASVTGLEIAEDHDEDGTSSRVVARLNTGDTLDFGEAWTNMDDAEKLAFVTTRARAGRECSGSRYARRIVSSPPRRFHSTSCSG